jgi:hypothetical protein
VSSEHERWAVKQLVGSTGYVLTEIVERPEPGRVMAAMRRLNGMRWSGEDGFARGMDDGIRYSHPDGTTGVLPWARVPEIAQQLTGRLW